MFRQMNTQDSEIINVHPGSPVENNTRITAGQVATQSSTRDAMDMDSASDVHVNNSHINSAPVQMTSPPPAQSENLQRGEITENQIEARSSEVTSSTAAVHAHNNTQSMFSDNSRTTHSFARSAQQNSLPISSTDRVQTSEHVARSEETHNTEPQSRAEQRTDPRRTNYLNPAARSQIIASHEPATQPTTEHSAQHDSLPKSSSSSSSSSSRLNVRGGRRALRGNIYQSVVSVPHHFDDNEMVDSAMLQTSSSATVNVDEINGNEGATFQIGRPVAMSDAHSTRDQERAFNRLPTQAANSDNMPASGAKNSMRSQPLVETSGPQNTLPVHNDSQSTASVVRVAQPTPFKKVASTTNPKCECTLLGFICIII